MRSRAETAEQDVATMKAQAASLAAAQANVRRFKQIAVL